jgi:hypothetical protein
MGEGEAFCRAAVGQNSSLVWNGCSRQNAVAPTKIPRCRDRACRGDSIRRKNGSRAANNARQPKRGGCFALLRNNHGALRFVRCAVDEEGEAFCRAAVGQNPSPIRNGCSRQYAVAPTNPVAIFFPKPQKRVLTLTLGQGFIIQAKRGAIEP